jgi:hypothetical protein
VDRNPCPYCSFGTATLHALFDHLERKHVLDLVAATGDGGAQLELSTRR